MFAELLTSFQYIPCYCLSDESKLKTVFIMNFNTSHVTVYPGLFLYAQHSKTFQYIPCYCLSGTAPTNRVRSAISIHPMLLFIDPLRSGPIGCSRISIHPMLLFIYIRMQYRKSRIEISIHPMLLFIADIKAKKLGGTEFQYIPCYCLSSKSMRLDSAD